MAIPVHLQQFTAAGIYRVVFDKSTIEGYSAQTLRLVVGYSPKGLFNTPVLIKSATEFVKTFGNISKTLEKRGIFFHRMALQALGTGPIIALNLKRLADGNMYETDKDGNYKTDKDGNYIPTKVERVGALSIDVMPGKEFPISGVVRLEDIYDTTRFWNLSPTQLNEYTNIYEGSNEPHELANYINIVSSDVKETSCTIFMRKSNIKGYDVTVKDWFAGNEDDRPEWLTDDSALMSDFMAEVYVFRGKFEPSIVQDPNFNKFFIVNTSTTGERSLYLKPYVTDAFGEIKDTLDELAKVPQANFIAKYQGSLIPYLKDKANRYIALDLLFNADNYVHNMMMNLNTNLCDEEDFTIDLNKYEYLTKTNIEKIVSDEFKGGNLTLEGAAPALLINTISPAVLKGEYDEDSESYTYNSADVFVGKAPIIAIPTFVKEEKDTWNITTDAPTTTISFDITKIVEDTETGEQKTVETNAYKAWTALGISLGERFAAVPQGDETGGFVYVDNIESDESKNQYTISFSGKVFNDGYLLRLQGSLANQFSVFEPTYVEGYTYSDPYPVDKDGKKSSKQWPCYEWQTRLLSALTDYKGLRIGLTSKTESEYRYIIDTFDSYVAPECKAILSKLAQEKENALAILNFPSMRTFADCDYASYRGNDGKFDATLIPSGGNPMKPRANVFTLPDTTNGASFCAFYTQVKFSDGTLNTICPSAALVSNNFMMKYSTTHPYYIVAGPNYGMITYSGLVGPDYKFSQEELEALEPYGVNCMLYVPKVGTYINADQTAKQAVKSALSKVHVRELVTYLQDEIAKILQKYHWEFNTQTVRDQIKERADSICENVKANGGLQAYLNIMDSSNNTPEIIDNQMAVLSTHIEPGMGMGIMVHELTIYRTGEMASSVQTNV